MASLRDSADWKWLLGFMVALVIGGLGIAVAAATGLRQGAAVWQSPFWYVGWGLVATGAALPLWKLWPRVRGLRLRLPLVLRSPLYAPKQAPRGFDLALLGHPLVVNLEEALAREKARSSELVAQLEVTRKERDAEKRGRAEAEAKAAARFNELRYGIHERMMFEPIDEYELAVAWDHMKRVRSVVEAAGRGALGLAGRLRQDMAGGDERSRVISEYFAERFLHPAEHLLDRLREELIVAAQQGVRADYREWLMHFYVAYNELRRVIGQMVRFRGSSLGEYREYREWKDLDRQFLASIGEIGALHDAIEAVNGRRGYPVALGQL